MLGFLKKLFGGMPKPSGPPKRIAKVDKGTTLISDNAMWVDDGIVVKVAEAETVRIVEIPIERAEQCQLGLRFKLSSHDVSSGAYPEIWVSVDGFGEAFSKGLNFKMKGSNDWSSCELPFFLKQNEPATLLKFNLVFEGAGTLLVKELELFVTPME